VDNVKTFLWFYWKT